MSAGYSGLYIYICLNYLDEEYEEIIDEKVICSYLLVVYSRQGVKIKVFV